MTRTSLALLIGALCAVAGSADARAEDDPVRSVRRTLLAVREGQPAERRNAHGRFRAEIRAYLDSGGRLDPALYRVFADDALPTLLRGLTSGDPGSPQSLEKLSRSTAFVTEARRRGGLLRKDDVSLVTRVIRGGESDLVPVLRLARDPLPVETIGMLRTAFTDPDFSFVRGSVCEVLASGGARAQSELVGMFVHAWRLREVWLLPAGSLADVPLAAKPVETLVVLASSKEPSGLRAAALRALTGSATPESAWLRRIQPLLKAPEFAVRDAAARLIGRGGERMREHESTLLTIAAEPEAEGAPEALATLGPRQESLTTIVGILSTSKWHRTRRWLLLALAKLGKAATSAAPLVRRLQREAVDASEKEAATIALRAILK